MDIAITPHELTGSIAAIPSKSMAHRLLLLSALCDGITDVTLSESSDDIDATLRCVTLLGASVGRTRSGLRVVPLTKRGVRSHARLDVGESGSTLRFLLPVVAALGHGASIMGRGRLAQRPLAPLDEQLIEHGIELSDRGSFPLEVSGTLEPGRFTLPGDVSSQFTSGLLMAAPLINGTVEIAVSEPIESLGYLNLTVDALRTFGVEVSEERRSHKDKVFHVYTIAPTAHLVSPGSCNVEGDWSNAAFWLAAGALGTTPLSVLGLNLQSRQGDRAIMAALTLLGARVGRRAGIVASSRDVLRGRTIDVSAIPDLAAPIASVASVARGTTRLTGAARLRLKESDRLETIRTTIVSLGGRASIERDDLVIEGVPSLSGGDVDAANDHRIAMMAAVCAAYATGPTIIHGAECVTKSYPRFFDNFRTLGGIAEERQA